MIAPQFAKLLWALQESAFPALLLFGRNRQIGVLIYDVTSHLGCYPMFTFFCLFIRGPRCSRSDKGGRIARRKCFFEGFVNAVLTALRGSRFIFIAHRGQRSATSLGSTALEARVAANPGSVTGRPYGVVNCATDRSHKSRADARGRQSNERDVVLSEKVKAARAALEYADVPFAIRSHASGSLDHRPATVRTGGGFEHAE